MQSFNGNGRSDTLSRLSMSNSQPQYDIAIIGGGLAGLTLAIQSADAGFSVVLFEKENYPFHKVCGEYISMESYDFLLRCGVPLREWTLPMISKLEVSDAGGKLYDFKLPLGGFGVSRYLLDNTLYKLALSKGVTIHTRCKVNDVLPAKDDFSVITGSGHYLARVVTGCFGKRSNLDLKWNRSFAAAKPNRLNNYIGVKYHIRYPQPADTISLHNFKDGYCGISQIENDTCCLCYLTTAENLHRSGNSIVVMQQNILAKNRELKKIFSGASFLFAQPVTISQVSFLAKEQVVNHVLMPGDSAGMITPLCGNGMSMAMHAGKLAFEQISLFLQGRITRVVMEENYRSRWQKEFGARTKMGRIVQSFFGGTSSTSLFLRAMHRFPVVSSMLIGQTHGKPF